MGVKGVGSKFELCWRGCWSLGHVFACLCQLCVRQRAFWCQGIGLGGVLCERDKLIGRRGFVCERDLWERMGDRGVWVKRELCWRCIGCWSWDKICHCHWWWGVSQRASVRWKGICRRGLRESCWESRWVKVERAQCWGRGKFEERRGCGRLDRFVGRCACLSGGCDESWDLRQLGGQWGNVER